MSIELNKVTLKLSNKKTMEFNKEQIKDSINIDLQQDDFIQQLLIELDKNEYLKILPVDVTLVKPNKSEIKKWGTLTYSLEDSKWKLEKESDKEISESGKYQLKFTISNNDDDGFDDESHEFVIDVNVTEKKEIIKNKSQYAIDCDVSKLNFIVGESSPSIPLNIKTTKKGNVDSEKVTLRAEVTGPRDSDTHIYYLKLKEKKIDILSKDSNKDNLFSLSQDNNDPISLTTSFNKSGDYNITFKLMDLDSEESEDSDLEDLQVDEKLLSTKTIKIHVYTSNEEINAIKVLETAEKTKSSSDIKLAQDAIEKVLDKTAKSELLKRLNVINSYNTIMKEANEKIGVYELTLQSFQSGDIDAFTAKYKELEVKRKEAYDAINNLKEDDKKQQLLNRYYVAQNHQYAAYKVMLIGASNGAQLEPIKIEKVKGEDPFKITFKNILPGKATSAWLFMPNGYWRDLNKNKLYPNDYPTKIECSLQSDNISVKAPVEGQYLMMFEIDNKYYKFVYDIDSEKNITKINNEEIKKKFKNSGDTWIIDKSDLSKLIEKANQLLQSHKEGFAIGEATKEQRSQFQKSISDAEQINSSESLYTLEEIKAAEKTLNSAIELFNSKVNTIDKTELMTVISSAKKLLDSTNVGTDINQISKDEKDKLQQAYDQSLQKSNSEDIRTENIKEEAQKLTTAIEEFKKNIITAENLAEKKIEAYEKLSIAFFKDIIKKKINTMS